MRCRGRKPTGEGTSVASGATLTGGAGGAVTAAGGAGGAGTARATNVYTPGAKADPPIFVRTDYDLYTGGGAGGAGGGNGSTGPSGNPGPGGSPGGTGPSGATGPSGTPGGTGPSGSAGAAGSQGPAVSGNPNIIYTNTGTRTGPIG